MAGTEGIERRLARSAEAVRAYRESYEAELEVRDRLIMEATEAGYTWREIAELADVSVARINQVILRRSTEVPALDG